jgi:hypothetical protein
MGVMMKTQALFVLSIAVVGAAFAVPSQAATPATSDGLVAVQSRNLDELYLRPNADLASYRKIVIDPVQVTFHKDWNKVFVDLHGVTRQLRQDDVQRIAEDTASTMQSAVAEAFKARGYEIAAAPGPGVLRLSPSVVDLYVSAAGDLSPGTTKSFTKDAGEATLILEARDAVSGAVLGRAVDHRTARETKGTQLGDLRRTTSVSNIFWFDEAFRRWAAACATEFEASKPSKIGFEPRS